MCLIDSRLSDTVLILQHGLHPRLAVKDTRGIRCSRPLCLSDLSRSFVWQLPPQK